MNNEAFIKKNWLKITNREIGEKLGLSETQVRRIAKGKLKLPPKPQNFRSGDNTKTDQQKYIDFMSKAKTEREIKKRYGKLRLDKIKGYKIFTQRNPYNELLYILLPTMLDKVELLPKQYDYHLGKSEDGRPQPYILCQLPKFKGNIKIAPLFDIHYGNFAHKHEKFLKYLQWIKDNKDVYVILGGDLMENAIDDGRGMTYDQNENPHTQLDDMIKFLAPISHKILCATTGNHEERTYKKTGIDVMKTLADTLKVPYFSGPIWLSIVANGFKWNLFIQHGRGNSQTKGGKMNMANRPKKFTGVIHFFISGHVHDRVCESETIITDDPINCRLVYLDQWTIVAPAFLHWEDTYAYRAGYPPPAAGGVAIELTDDGTYRASLT